MPENVVKVMDLKDVKVNQIFIGSCKIASFTDFAKIVENKYLNDDVSFSIACSSRQIFRMLQRNGIISELVVSGARILECGCGPCE